MSPSKTFERRKWAASVVEPDSHGRRRIVVATVDGRAQDALDRLIAAESVDAQVSPASSPTPRSRSTPSSLRASQSAEVWFLHREFAFESSRRAASTSMTTHVERAGERARALLARCERSVRRMDCARAFLACVTVLALARALARTPSTTIANVPAAIGMTLIGAVIARVLEHATARERELGRRSGWRGSKKERSTSGSTWTHGPDVEIVVRCFPEVWSAWVELREKIIADYVTSLWYESLTDDADVPNALRAILDEAFARLSNRAREMDLVSLVLREIPDVFSQSLEAYRSARAEIGEEEFRKLCPEDAEDILACVLKKQGELHPAVSGEIETASAFRVLSAVMADILVKKEFASPLTVPLVRELLVVSLLRPLFGFAKPHWANRGILFVTGTVVDYKEDALEKGGDNDMCVSESGENERRVETNALARHSRSASDNSSDTMPSGLYSDFKLSARVTGAEIVGSGSSSYAVYLVTVTTNENEMWVVPRRFRNFETLHRRLREVDKVAVNALEFPSKSWIKLSLSGAFIESRRKALDAYLRAVLVNEKLAASAEVFSFMDARPGIYDPDKPSVIAPELVKTMSDAMEGMASMVTSYTVGESTDGVNESATDEDKSNLPAKKPPLHRRISSMYEETASTATKKSVQQMTKTSSESENGSDTNEGSEDIDEFVADIESCLQGPVLDLFECVFVLRSKPMMRRALVSLVRQSVAFIFSIERSISKRFQEFRSPRSMARTIAWIRRVVWPEIPYPADTPERLACEADTARQTLLGVFSNQNVKTIMGARASARAANDVFSLLQSPVCCRHVGFVALETVVCALFPEILAKCETRAPETADAAAVE